MQEQLKEEAYKSNKAFLIGFECPACVTLGLRGRETEDLSGSLEEYQKKNIEIITIKRGGQATLHSLGQLGYLSGYGPITMENTPQGFFIPLEKVTKNTLKKYGNYI